MDCQLWKPFIDPVTYEKAKFIYSKDKRSLKLIEEIFGKNILMELEEQYDHSAFGQIMQANDLNRKAYWNQSMNQVWF